jgi:antitoxin HicB
MSRVTRTATEAMARNNPVAITPLSSKEGGGCLATVPDLPGCTSDGQSREEAARNVGEAILERIDEAQRLGREVPSQASQTVA